MLGALPDPCHEPVAFLEVVGLERIVVPVLAVPDVDQWTTELGGDIHHGLRVGDGLRPDVRILRRERAGPVDLRGKMVGDDRDEVEVVILELRLTSLDVLRRDVPRADDLDAAQTGHADSRIAQLLERAVLAITGKEPVRAIAEVADNDRVLVLLHLYLLGLYRKLQLAGQARAPCAGSLAS